MRRTVWLLVYMMPALLALGLPSNRLTIVSVAQAQSTDGKTVLVSGATTVANLLQPLVGEFEAKQPGVRVIVQGSTHGKGFDALIEKRTDVCMTARSLTRDELDAARIKGIAVSEEFLANDAVAIVTNPANPVDALSIPQLAKIFHGDYTNWRDVEGSDEPIQVITTSPEGGMASFLSNTIFKKPFTEKPYFESLPPRVPLWVSAKKGAIGFCRTSLAFEMSAAGKVKILAIKKSDSSPAVPLSEETLRDGSYPIMRALGLCYDRGRASKHVKEFVEFCQTKVKDPQRVAQQAR